MDKVISASHIPSITRAYSLSKRRSNKSTDQFKSLIKKQQKNGYTEDNIIQRIQANPFSYDTI